MSKEIENEKKPKKSNQKSTTKKSTSSKKTVDEKVKKEEKAKATKTSQNKAEKKVEKEFKIIEPMEEEYDEDLDIEEDSIEMIEIPKKEKKEKKEKEEKKKEDKIQKIEKIAKEKKKHTSKGQNSWIQKFIYIFEKNYHIILSFVGGALLVTLIAFIIWPDRIATLKNGEQPVVKVAGKTYTANDLYENMKDYYSVSLLLDEIDNDLLTKMYPENSEMTEEVNANAENYYNTYKQYYNYTQEQFLSQNGFASHEAFLEYLRLDYRRNKYLDEYVEKSLTDDDIQKYYDDKVFGDINTQHILVEVSSSDDDGKLSDEDAKKLAEEIITKLNDGTSWETIQKDYKDKITFEDLGYQSWDASLEESFMNALKNMDNNSYSEEPVKTSYGYHVIYRLDQKKKPSLKKTKDKIIDNLITDKKAEDSNLLYKSLISLRKEKKIDFSDTVMKSKYNEYCKKYN